MTSRFVADFEASWQGNVGVMTEVFTYDSGRVQNREWRLTVDEAGRIRAEAADVVGVGPASRPDRRCASAIGLNWPKVRGAMSWTRPTGCILPPTGRIMNRSQFRKFGLRWPNSLQPCGASTPPDERPKMRDWQGKRYWLIGASEGLGRELALSLSRAGTEVIVSARSADRLAALVAEMPGKARALALGRRRCAGGARRRRRDRPD